MTSRARYPRHQAPGFTLVEMMVSLAISSVVIMALLGVTTTHLSFANQSASRVTLSTDLLFLTDYFSREITNSGGEYVPVWAAIGVEDRCVARDTFPDCQNSDRLSLVRPVDFNSCPVVKTSGATLFLDPTDCCLDAIDPLHAHVMLVRNADFAEKWVSSVNKKACTVTVTAGPLAFRDTVPASYDWSTGNMTPVNVQTFYLDQATTILMRHTYTNGGNTPGDAIDDEVADSVLDLQVALGFDFKPKDGVITDSGDSTDEWLYNDPNANEAMGAGVFAATTATSLRMVNLGLAVGMTADGAAYRHTAQVLNGPRLNNPKTMMGDAHATTLLRSVADFQ